MASNKLIFDEKMMMISLLF